MYHGKKTLFLHCFIRCACGDFLHFYFVHLFVQLSYLPPPSFARMWMLVVFAVFVASLVVFSGALYKVRHDMQLLDDRIRFVENELAWWQAWWDGEQ